MNLRTELIRTAKEKPHLREAILPLVRKAGHMSSDLEWGLKSLSTSNELLERPFGPLGIPRHGWKRIKTLRIFGWSNKFKKS